MSSNPQTKADLEGSPASNGGRGLKRQHEEKEVTHATGFARQQWRAWIETIASSTSASPGPGSPASNGGRGLKPVCQQHRDPLQLGSPASNGGRGLKQAAALIALTDHLGFARQQWRAWIETRGARS